MLEHRDRHKTTTSVGDGLELAPQNAHLLYERGMIELANGNEKRAIEWIEKSNSWDLVPDATPEINEIIRQLASQHDLKLVDLERFSQAYLRQPNALFLDKVHLNAAGSQLVASEVSQAVKLLLESP